jgi:hypothetical protein
MFQTSFKNHFHLIQVKTREMKNLKYTHEQTCPFLRLLHLTGRLQYGDIRYQDLYDGLVYYGFGRFAHLIALASTNPLLKRVKGKLTIDEVCKPGFLEHNASLCKRDETPSVVDDDMIKDILALDAADSIKFSSLIWYVCSRNFDSFRRTRGCHAFSVLGVIEASALYKLLKCDGFRIPKRDLLIFLTGDIPVYQ